MATTLKNLGAKWLSEKKINFTSWNTKFDSEINHHSPVTNTDVSSSFWDISLVFFCACFSQDDPFISVMETCCEAGTGISLDKVKHFFCYIIPK